VAERWNISRETQDDFAAQSQKKAGEAIKSGHFDKEILPIDIPGRKGQVGSNKKPLNLRWLK